MPQLKSIISHYFNETVNEMSEESLNYIRISRRYSSGVVLHFQNC